MVVAWWRVFCYAVLIVANVMRLYRMGMNSLPLINITVIY